MECKKCGKSIDEFNDFCSDCKELLESEKELDKLIFENKELNKLEITKEVVELTDIKEEKKEDIKTLKEELMDIVNIQEVEEQEKENKNIIIIVTVLTVIVITLIITLILIFGKKEEIHEEKSINYKQVIKNYAASVELAISDYIKENEKIPSWGSISDVIDYEDYEVACSIHNIYKDGTIYLNECEIEGDKVKYSYGEEKEEISGKKIDIYKDDVGYNDNNGSVVGSIMCTTDSCEYIKAYDKYVLIKEENKYYIYDYINSSIEFGPFSISGNYNESMLSYEDKLYGILYVEDNIQNIYNLNLEKKLKKIEGKLMLSQADLNTKLLYKYGYAIFENNNKNNFVNLKTGNVSYSIGGVLTSFIENSNNNLVYIITKSESNSKITIYNSNGKALFSGKEFNDIKLLNNIVILSGDNNYYVYDYNLKLKLTSKAYDNILGLYDDFVVVVDKGYLEIVDLEDNILATFDLKWDNSMYKFDNILSNKTLENNEEIIYLIIERSNSSLKYYYNINTKEFGLK